MPDDYWVHASADEWAVERQRRLDEIDRLNRQSDRSARIALALGSVSIAALLLSTLLRAFA